MLFQINCHKCIQGYFVHVYGDALIKTETRIKDSQKYGLNPYMK